MTATTIDFEWLSILSGWSLLNDSAALLRTPGQLWAGLEGLLIGYGLIAGQWFVLATMAGALA
ncbi:hypothetical protein [Stenotrophomonas maltophilia]|uniref:hypothetical protein n=1 Tax=Stenotrophomonas maltophilia TaxID=40324 RepID=UPI0021C6B5EA|nr:hypothetical protein [Stenotrophomonas maltophilia]MCU1209918.1 hypothetical protein [Stenotrophomonas maltophilia]